MYQTSMLGFALLATLLCFASAPVNGQQSDEKTAIAHLQSIGVELETANKKVVGVNFFQSTGTDSDIRYLVAIPSIREINFGQHAFTDNAMKHISNLNNVRSINLSLCPITNTGLAAICTNPNLETLDLAGTNITDLRPLTQLRKLKHLELQHCAIADSQIVRLAKIQSLVELNLGSTEVTDIGVKSLTQLPKLEVLILAGVRVTDASAKVFEDCPSLKKLQLAYGIGKSFEPGRCHISADVLGDLKRKLSGVQVMGKPAKPIEGKIELVENDQSVVKQMTLKQLSALYDKSMVTSIDFSNSIVDDDSLESLAKFTNVKSLNLAHTWITDLTLKKIGGLNRLESLDIHDTRVTDAGMAHLKTCTNLAMLNLHNTLVTDNAFGSLAGLTGLVDLDVSRNAGQTKWNRVCFAPWISNDGLLAISQFKKLERLNLNCYDYTPKKMSANGIRLLFKLTKLQELSLFGLPVDDDFEKEFKRKIPSAKFINKMGSSFGFFDRSTQAERGMF